MISIINRGFRSRVIEVDGHAREIGPVALYIYTYVNARRDAMGCWCAVNTISLAVMEYAGAAGLLAKWRLIVLSRHCQYILPGAVQVPQKLLCYKEKTCLSAWVCARVYVLCRWSRCYKPDITYHDDLQNEYECY